MFFHSSNHMVSLLILYSPFYYGMDLLAHRRHFEQTLLSVSVFGIVSNMGARVARLFRNFNLENRVHREISKEKPRAAPRHEHPGLPSAGSSEEVDPVNQKSDPLLANLQSVFVQSTDPAAAAEASKTEAVSKEMVRRPLKYSLPVHGYGLVELTDVPKGKLTITEALKALGSHQQQPQTWTPEKIAQDYSLDLKDTKALLEFFIPFQIQVIPPKTDSAKQIKAS
ncbi:NADH dehydrogenase [ubiquinone] 1 alpha subcomplex assembly factor 4 isoform X3 [Acanthopagrus latus]|uniref:NADH dehydrogenase [ubiquinone] 1 alpha subcomplex assembly factor 4 isoform X3 n=1 Tax=Acanthopagrus latus TaxID=8177 RepID=UPI00187C66AC|nr:NADH dehydrogenase [ubiquinone] 1 alpha subcomplex assembly factor 4 isoform X3 [Acanthopagrus latus]